MEQKTRWNAFQMPTDTKSGVICLLEFKRMSDVTSHYIVRAKSVSLAQYESHDRHLARSCNTRVVGGTPTQLCRGIAVPK